MTDTGIAAIIASAGPSIAAVIIALRSNRKSDDAHDRMDAAGIPKTVTPEPTQVDEKEAVRRAVEIQHRDHRKKK